MRLLFTRLAALVLLLVASRAVAQGSKESVGENIRLIRQLLEEQSRQLDNLTQQVAKLSQTVDATHPGAVAPAPSPASTLNTPPAQETNPVPVASAQPVNPETGPATGAATHVVTRGETLTSIAKIYKVSVGDLQKENNIHNDRTLQIGQTLTIPAAKAGDGHKKEKQ